MKKKLRIGVNAQLPSGNGAGGIETVVRTLATLFGRLDGDEEYVFIGHWSDSDWLKPLLTSERQTIVRAPRPDRNKPTRTEIFKRVLGPLRPLVRGVRHLVAPPLEPEINVRSSDGFYENLNCDVIHFPYQDYVYCRVPTVFSPHDLQHLHYPEFFAPEEIRRREVIYPAACRAASALTVTSQFVKRDVAEKYRIEADKIQVIPVASIETALGESTEQEIRALFEKYRFQPDSFILYPAMTWEHKNHIRLLEAVALLRDRDNLKINLVCTGHKNSFFPRIEHRLRELKLEDRVKFTGFVTTAELRIFYRQARFVVVPTLFEASSAPVFEAWQHGIAVACSSVTSLPEQAAGAALLFNPFSVEEIAAAVKKLTSDESARADFGLRGSERLRNFDGDIAAKMHRAVYRKAAGFALSEEDKHLLSPNRLDDS